MLLLPPHLLFRLFQRSNIKMAKVSTNDDDLQEFDESAEGVRHLDQFKEIAAGGVSGCLYKAIFTCC